MLKLSRSCFYLTSVLALSGCVAIYDQGGVDSLEELHKLGDKTFQFKSIETNIKNNVRHTLINDTALSLGAQAGLAWQYKNINLALEENAKKLDQVFNFHALILPHNVMPPVLLEGHHTLKQDDPNVIRLTDRSYRIKQHAHFVTAPPNWRQYLWQSFSKPELPPHNLLPKSPQEQEIWKRCINKGWKDGMRQAIEIFDSNLAKLVEDYRGIAVYRKLLAQNMVTPPFVAKTNLGVTGDNEQLNINDQVLRIAVQSTLRTDLKGWHPAISSSDGNGNTINAGFGKNSSQGQLENQSKRAQSDPEKTIVITQHLTSN